MPLKPSPRLLRNAIPTPRPRSQPHATTAPMPEPKPYQRYPVFRSPAGVAPTTTTLKPPPPPPPPSRFRHLERTLAIVTFASLAFVTLIDSVITVDTVRGSSMAPTLSPDAHLTGKNDLVVIRRIVTARPGNVQRGDIVTFWKPHRPGEISIKRVVGTGGDVVFPSRGYALEPEAGEREHEQGKENWNEGSRKNRKLLADLNDGLVGEEVYEGGGVWGESRREVGKVVVPYNHIWVEGDNWRNSLDSNDFGPVSLSLVDGKAVRVWRNGWWREIADGRKTTEKEGKSRVVQGRGGALAEVFKE